MIVRRGSPRIRLKDMIYLFILFYFLLAGFLFVAQRSLIYFPGTELPDPAIFGTGNVQVVQVTPKDMGSKTISGWFLPPASDDQPVILYLHGNALTHADRMTRAQQYTRAGYGVLLAGYRGYGGNPGKPTEYGLYADAEAYYQWLLQSGIQPRNIVIYGESLGTGVATFLANLHPEAMALVLESPYSSIVDVARLRFFFLPIDLMMKDKYDSQKRIANIHIPVLFLHAEHDAVIPLRFGKKLYAAANNPKEMKIFSDGGHNDLYNYGAADAVLGFLQNLERKR